MIFVQPVEELILIKASFILPMWYEIRLISIIRQSPETEIISEPLWIYDRQNIAHDIRIFIDMIDYTNTHDVPGALLLLDLEQAFDSVEHEYLYKVLERFDVGQDFITWIKCFDNTRNSYVLNNGYMSPIVNMKRGIFQECPISPYLFLLAIEMLGISIRNNSLFKGIQIGDMEQKVSMYADDAICFLNGDFDSIKNLFDTLDKFGAFSGCKVNLSKSEGV